MITVLGARKSVKVLSIKRHVDLLRWCRTQRLKRDETMNDIVAFYTQPLPHGHEHRSRLLQEIAFLEGRLTDLSAIGEGDNAYERALGRTYQALLGLRRSELASLNS